AAAFPELNAWERAGADASSAGMVDAGFENQKELTKMQLDNQKEIAEMQNETQKEIAGIQSATSRQNTKDQRSEERFSRNAETELVCRLLLEKKKKQEKTKHQQYNKRTGRAVRTHFQYTTSQTD